MQACYDLQQVPPTFDIVAFLALAELERIRRNEQFLDIHILPGPAGGFRKDLLWPPSVEGRQVMLEKVVIPMCWMLPSVNRVQVHEDRPEGFERCFGYREYLISLPRYVEGLKQGCRPLRPIYGNERDASLIRFEEPYKADRITLTLREAHHHPRRNSRLPEWRQAALILQARGYEVIVIRDTVAAAESLPGLLIHPMASVDLHARSRLYASAGLNIGINNGPMWMAISMGVPTLMLRPTTDVLGGCYSSVFFKQCGVPPGSQLPTSPANQRIVWKDDTVDNIIEAFEGFLK